MSAVSAPERRTPANEIDDASSRIRWGVELAWVAGASLITLVLAGVAMRIWNMSLHVPLSVGGDSAYGVMLVEHLTNNGWIGVNNDIGAPYGSILYDHTAIFGDFTQLIVIKAMSMFSDDPVALLNAFFLLTFPMVVATTYVVLRVLRFPPAIAAACAAIYALMPFHFLRGPVHIMLSAYYAVPVGALLILGLLGHATLFRRRKAPGSRWLTWVSSRTVMTIVACIFVGASESYYALFTVLIAAPVGLVAAFGGQTVRKLVATTIVCGVVLGSMIAVQAPTIIYHAQNGKNENVASRAPWESEFFGLRMLALTLPSPEHRVTGLAEFSQKYYLNTQLNGEGSSAGLGFLMTLGLLLAVAVAASAAVGRRIASARWQLVRDAGVAGLLTFLIGTVSGGSALIAYLISPTIRGWNRISVFIAFFAIIGLATLLFALRDRLVVRGVPSWVPAVLLLPLVGFAAWDQTTARAVPPYSQNLAQWQNDARFGAAAEAALPEGADVLQLPYVPFPEHPPVFGMVDYDHFKGIAHADDLDWSYGAVKGRYPDDWAASSAQLPVKDLLPAAAAAGFRGLYVDKAGYADGGAQIVADSQKVTGRPPIVVSDDDRLVLFDLEPLTAEQRRDATPAERRAGARALLEPVEAAWGSGFFPRENDATSVWYWAGPTGTIALDNPSSVPRRMDLSFDLATPGTRSHFVTLTFPDGRIERFRTRTRARPLPVRTSMVIPPGKSSITATTNAPDELGDPRDLRMRFVNPELLDAGYSRLADAVGD